MQAEGACHRSHVTKSQAASSARNLTLTLGTSEAPVDILRGIDLDIARGSTVALLGPSGSGKSSLMAVLSGLERATGGSLQVAGADFATMDEDALAHARRGRIGIVLQAFHLLPTMTALENVATPMELAGASDAQARAKAELEAVGLGHRLDHYPQQLSGGEQQRVAIARAIAPRPDLIFADEPTGNLDPEQTDMVLNLFKKIHQQGTTIVLATHEVDIVDKLQTRVIRLEEGGVIRDSVGGYSKGKSVQKKNEVQQGKHKIFAEEDKEKIEKSTAKKVRITSIGS